MKNRYLHLSLYAPCVKHNLLRKQKTKKINFQSERNNHSTVQLWYLHNHSYGFYYSGFPHHCVLFFFFIKIILFFFLHSTPNSLLLFLLYLSIFIILHFSLLNCLTLFHSLSVSQQWYDHPFLDIVIAIHIVIVVSVSVIKFWSLITSNYFNSLQT